MSLGLAFYVLLLIWGVFGILSHIGFTPGIWGATTNAVLLFVLFLLLGWQTFGAPLHK
jgi:hypothetical protein